MGFIWIVVTLRVVGAQYGQRLVRPENRRNPPTRQHLDQDRCSNRLTPKYKAIISLVSTLTFTGVSPTSLSSKFSPLNPILRKG
jgi:hypothetical protein